jgi:hypothetical protein
MLFYRRLKCKSTVKTQTLSQIKNSVANLIKEPHYKDYKEPAHTKQNHNNLKAHKEEVKDG